MKENIIILSASPYSFTDERTGEIRKGISCQYLMTGSLTPAEDTTTSFKGYKVLKSSLSMSETQRLVSVPGLYEADMSILAKATGKAEIKIKSVTFKNSLKN